MQPEQIILWGGGALLALSALLALCRIIAGPTVLDRVVASDVLLTTILLLLAFEMIVHRHTNSIPVMVGIAATAALATVTVARFVRRQPEKEKQAVGGDASSDNEAASELAHNFTQKSGEAA